MKKLKRKKRCLFQRVSVLMSIILMLGITSVSSETNGVSEDGTKVLYYETFDSGAQGIASGVGGYTKESLSITEQGKMINREYYTKYDEYGIGRMALSLADSMNGSDWFESEYNGNPGFSVRNSAAGTRSFYEFNEAIDSGVLSYSFDVSRLERDENASGADKVDVGQTALGRLNMGTAWADNAKSDGLEYRYVFYLDYKQTHSGTVKSGFYGPNANLTNWGDANTCSGEYEMNKVYHVNQVFDLNNHMCYTYVDGKEITGGGRTINSKQRIKTLDIFISKYMTYFDNFKITYSDKLYMNVETATASINSDYAEIEFTDGINTSKLPNDGYSITDAETGEMYTATASVTKTKTLKLTAEGLNFKNGGLYIINMPLIYGNGGEVSKAGPVMLSVGSGDRLNDMEIKNSSGESFRNIGEIPADTAKIDFKFSNESAAESAQISLTDESGAAVDFITNQSGSNVELDITNYLIGKKTYNLKINGIDAYYDITLKTAEGGIKAASCKFYINGAEVTDLSGLSQNDTVKMVMTIAKTNAREENLIAVYSVYNENALTGFDMTEKTMTASESRTEFEFDIPVKSAENMRINGFLKAGINSINPIGSIYKIK